MKRKIKALFKNKRKASLILAAAAILAGGGLYYALRRQAPPSTDQPQPVFYSQLTGQEVDEDISQRPILGVIIENSEAARPQSGLDQAGIVFEATTEGGITRYLALYQEDLPEIVGPIRSLRTHFLNWGMGLDASIAHVGGSAEALSLAEKRDAKTLNQFFFADAFYRDNGRIAPHNMYAKVADLLKLQDDQNHNTASFAPIPRSDESPAAEPTATSVVIDYSSPTFKVEFRYDSATNRYIRYLAGEPHLDAKTKQPITVKNLVVLRTIGQQAIGKGQAIVFKDGQITDAQWQQKDFKTRLMIVDDNGQEVPLSRGDSWIAMLARDRTLSY